MTETAFLQYTGYVLAFFAVWIVARCARSMLSERYVPEVWGYLELPDGTSRAIEHWECILGRAKASDIVLTGEGIERSHAAIQRSGAGEWTLSALDGGRGVWLNGKAVTGDAPLRGGDTLKLGEMELHFLALDDAQRATLQRKRPLTGHKVQPAVTLLLLVCFQLVLLFQFFFTTDGAALAYIVLSFGLLIAMEWFCYFVMRSISVRGFEPETLAFFLTSVGFSVVGSSAPDGMGRHCLLFLAALALFFALGVWLRDLHRVRAMRWPMAFAALGFLALNLLLSETIWGAKNWLSIAGQTLQPSEFVKIAYVYAGAATLDRLFRRRNLILFIAFSAVCVGALALMGDFGTALVFFVCFLVISLTVSIGAMAVIGSIQDGIYGDHSTLVAKAILDFIIVLIMASSMGKGCVFSFIPVAVLQGAMTALAVVLSGFMTDAVLNNLSLVGNILIFCVGINLVWPRTIKVANLLPSLLVAVALTGIL